MVSFVADRVIVLSSVRSRQPDHGDDVELTDERAAEHFDVFEAPTSKGNPLRVIRSQPPASGAVLPHCGAAPMTIASLAHSYTARTARVGPSL